MSGEEFQKDSISCISLRPIIKISFRDCYSDPLNSKKYSLLPFFPSSCHQPNSIYNYSFENQWQTKYQIEQISYSVMDCFELLSIFHFNNQKMPTMCQEFSGRSTNIWKITINLLGMLNSWLYYMPSTWYCGCFNLLSSEDTNIYLCACMHSLNWVNELNCSIAFSSWFIMKYQWYKKYHFSHVSHLPWFPVTISNFCISA